MKEKSETFKMQSMQKFKSAENNLNHSLLSEFTRNNQNHEFNDICLRTDRNTYMSYLSRYPKAFLEIKIGSQNCCDISGF